MAAMETPSAPSGDRQPSASPDRTGCLGSALLPDKLVDISELPCCEEEEHFQLCRSLRGWGESGRAGDVLQGTQADDITR